MKFQNRISNAQQKFIRSLRDGLMTLDELKQTEKANPARFSKWYRNPFFWWHLRQAVFQGKRRSMVEAHLIAALAEAEIAEGVRNKQGLEPNHLATCKTAKEQSRADVRLELSRMRGGRRKKKGGIDRKRDLVHPNFKEREKEMMEALKKDREIGASSRA